MNKGNIQGNDGEEYSLYIIERRKFETEIKKGKKKFGKSYAINSTKTSGAQVTR